MLWHLGRRPSNSLPDLASALHDFLASRVHLLNIAHEQCVLLKDVNKALHRLRLVPAHLAELEVQKRLGMIRQLESSPPNSRT